jgi:hypothetical protein
MEKKKDESKNLLDLIKEKLIKIFQKTDNYTIEEYLKVLSDFTDSVILDSKKDELTFMGGEVVFRSEKELKKVKINVDMEFKSVDNQWQLKKAERKIDYSTFSKEAIEKIESEKEIRFNIEKPIEEEN